MWVRVYVRAWVRGCAPYLANISKIALDAPGAGRNTSTGETTETRAPPPNTSDHHKSRSGSDQQQKNQKKFW